MDGFQCRYDGCSYTANAEHGRSIHEGREHSGSKDRVEIKCDECGTVFSEPQSRAERATYCSRECRIENFTEIGKEAGKETRFEEGNEPWNKGLSIEESEKIQEVAMKTQKTQLGQHNHPETEFDSGEEHPNWDDEHEYEKGRGDNWSQKRLETLNRDNHTCQKCETPKSELGLPLDVHHIKAYKKFESDERANSVENLISLCRSCHMKVENGNEEIKQ